MTPPRIYCIPASAAPVVAVFRRGPSSWSHVGRWDLARLRYEPGAWLHARLFPRRSDLSPNGRWLCYFAHQPGARWAHGDTYVAVSRLPWLTALHAFPTCGTWTRGYAFTGDVRDGVPDLRLPGGGALVPVRAGQFATELRRGWAETSDSPPRDPTDAWDERRDARLAKSQPGGTLVLHVRRVRSVPGQVGVTQAVDGADVAYEMEWRGERQQLPDLQWADWDADGRLLAATRAGWLQVLAWPGDGPARVLFEENLAELLPDPVPPPAWAREW